MITLAGAGAIIKDSNDCVFLVRIKRRGMVRWELPTGIRKKGESVFLTLYRCVEQESSSQFAVRIGKAVCLAVNRSENFKHQFFAMFFECKAEMAGINAAEDLKINLPEEIQQKIIDSKFCNWREIKPTEIHPQHLEILKYWSNNQSDQMFVVFSDADSEFLFYNGKGTVISQLLAPFCCQDNQFVKRNRKESIDTRSNISVDITNHVFDVAVSFPGEARDYVQTIVTEIEKEMGQDTIFYDNYYLSQLARPSLDTLLQDIYANRSKLVVVFLCGKYQEKKWCGLELRAIRELIMNRNYDKVMLIKMDDGAVEGILKIDGSIDGRNHSASEVATLILERFSLIQ